MKTRRAGDEITLGAVSGRVLFTPEQIRDRVQEIGRSLRERLGDERPVFIGLLHGGFVFLSDLIRAFNRPHTIDFLKVSRYDPPGLDPTDVRLIQDLSGNIRGRTAVVVEGIRARGTKIEYVDRFLRLHEPSRIEYCAMIRPEPANQVVPLAEAGFSIGDEFVVGYGLDYREQFRNLPSIIVLESSREDRPSS